MRTTRSWVGVVGGLATVLVMGAASRAEADCTWQSSQSTYAWALNTNATALPLPNGTSPPTPGIEFQVRCTANVFGVDSYGASYSYTYDYNAASCTTTANGTCSTSTTISTSSYTQYPDCSWSQSDIWSCTLINNTQDRVIDWKTSPVNTVVTTETMGTLSGSALAQNRTWNNTVVNAAPAATTYWADASPHNGYASTGINYRSRLAWNSTSNSWTSVGRGASAVLFRSFDGVYDKPIVIIDGWDPVNERGAYDIYGNSGFIYDWQAKGLDVWVFNPAEGSESLRAHIDDLAYALKQIAEYGGLNRIDMVIGISAGGLYAQHTLAAMEHVKNGGSYPSWFTYAADAGRRAYGNKVAGFLSWDSPHAGAVGIPRDFLLMFRKFMTLTKNDLIAICNPKGKFWLRGFGRILGTTLAGGLFGPGGALAFNGFIAQQNRSVSTRAKAIAHNVYTLAAPVLDAGSTKDLLIDWCSSNSASSCNGNNSAAFRNEMLQFNGTGRPTQTKTFAFSQGSWAPLRCLWPDQWGDGTCIGSPGYYEIDGVQNGVYAWRNTYKTAKFSSPHAIGPKSAGDRIAQLDLFDSRCRNNASVYLAAKDVLPGSVSTVINDYIEPMNAQMADEATMKVYFASTFVATTSALNMTSATSTSTFKDVQWAPYSDRHESVHRNNYFFMNKLVYEFTFGDKDGTVTCNAVANWAFPAGRVGRFCACDPNDASAATAGACGTTPTCVPQTSCTGKCGRQEDGCGGTYDCAPCQFCGDGACTGTEVCDVCVADCSTCNPCGDGFCDNDFENYSNCPADCQPYGYCNYNYYCEPWLGETWSSCPSDYCY